MKNKKIDAISMIDERKLLLRYIRIQLFVFIVGTLLTITGICVSLKIFVFFGLIMLFIFMAFHFYFSINY